MNEVQSSELNPTREDFAVLLEEMLGKTSLAEGSVVKGKVVAIEKDLAVIDVGLKTEGRVPLKEFSVPGQDNTISVGDEVEVYLERVENALGEAVLSRPSMNTQPPRPPVISTPARLRTLSSARRKSAKRHPGWRNSGPCARRWWTISANLPSAPAERS